MTRYQYRQAADSVNMLKEGVRQGRYAECQDLTSSLYTFMGQFCSEDAPIMQALLRYYELLYKISAGEADQNTGEPALEAIRHALSVLPADKPEVVIIPYCAGMWDALESVYLAFAADDNYHTLVVPAPYYQKRQGESPAFTYEGGRFPANIPITHYDDYDFENRHPSIIFTHNVYDDHNAVTALDTRFWTANLKPHCDKLVYIPYYGRLRGKLTRKAHFFITALVASIDVFVVATEEERAFAEKLNEQHKLGAACAIVALGSPKDDRLLSYERKARDGALEMPEQWRGKIERSGKARRKVVFYNTTVTALLADTATQSGVAGERYLQKVQAVFDVFRKRDDVVLLWRPHPLLAATIKAMRPALADAWQQLVDNYIQEGIGIYDAGGDLDMAVAVSYAYYGDRSTVCNLFLQTNKYMLIQDTHILDDTPPLKLFFAVSHENDVYLTFFGINALFKTDANFECVEYVSDLPGGCDVISKEKLFFTPAAQDGKLIFPPLRATKIAVYAIDKNTFHSLDYELPDANRLDFYAAIPSGQWIYFTPLCYPGILRLDTHSGKTTCLADYIVSAQKILGEDAEIIASPPAIARGKLWFTISRTNLVVAFDIEREQSRIYTVGGKAHQFKAICFDGDAFWLSPMQRTKTPLIKWQPDTNAITEFEEIYNGDDDARYLAAVYSHGYIYLLPRKAQHAYQIDVRTNRINVDAHFAICNVKCDTAPNYNRVYALGNVIVASDLMNNALSVYNGETNQFVLRKPCLAPGAQQKISALVRNTMEQLNAIGQRIHYHYENQLPRLSDFLDFVVANDSVRLPSIEQQAGKSIYHYCKLMAQGEESSHT